MKKKYQRPEGRNTEHKAINKRRPGAGKDGGKSFVRKSRPGINTKSPDKKMPADQEPNEMRLNRYIAKSGICSRREADTLIEQGLVKVNGKLVTELGSKVKKGDNVKVEDKPIRPEKYIYVLLNKPKDFITTTDDPQERKTVMQLVASACEERIYPVGRLDRNTTGLLLFTNDGELADRLAHPSGNVKKVYQVDLDKPLTKEDFQKIVNGIELEDGLALVDDLAMASPDGQSVGIEIHIGKNRIVRRIFEALDYKVVRLDRVMYAGLTKKDIPRGKWRRLNDKEIVRLKHFGQ